MSVHSILGGVQQAAGALAPAADGEAGVGPWWAALIPALPMLGVVLTTLCAVFRVRSKLPAWLSVACLAAAFGVTLAMYLEVGAGTAVTTSFEWIRFTWGDGEAARTFVADWGFYIDPLTCLWMLFVTGLGALIALYASEYMAHDVGTGYCRFFAAFDLFVFAMTCLVMADNLVLLFLGWEGVGLCSYLLIGYFYKKPSAVEAAKKAFIMNRIGDLGLILGLMATFVVFGTVEYRPLFDLIARGVDGAGQPIAGTWVEWVIPLLLTVGAFGKSAQLFLYVWLPDAMEGPTPVSALIHAATMVTAGVYLIARMYPLYTVDPGHLVLHVVAWSGAITALWSATIGMAQFDIKRIMAYSTVSQLGYMFAGLGVLTSVGAAFHVFTHAFFKATLFLCCGAVMHGFAGQLDLRRLSGVMSMKGWLITGAAMLIGCLNLAGFPFTAGFFSKDMILAEAFVTPGMSPIGWILLVTAGLTAYYTFRVFFRVFVGPRDYQPGDEAHGQDDHGHDGHGDHADGAHGAAPAGGGDFHPHAPGWAINTVLAILAVSSVLVAGTYFVGEHHGWVGGLIHDSTAHYQPAHGAGEAHGTFLGFDPHVVMYFVSAGVGLIGILAAARLHGPRGAWGLGVGTRTKAACAPADALLPSAQPVARWAQHKWYVDELYHFLFVRPLWVIGHILHLIDKLLVDGLVNLFGMVPRLIAWTVRPSQSGVLHGYAVGMAGGVAVLLLIVMLSTW